MTGAVREDYRSLYVGGDEAEVGAEPIARLFVIEQRWE